MGTDFAAVCAGPIIILIVLFGKLLGVASLSSSLVFASCVVLPQLLEGLLLAPVCPKFGVEASGFDNCSMTPR